MEPWPLDRLRTLQPKQRTEPDDRYRTRLCNMLAQMNENLNPEAQINDIIRDYKDSPSHAGTGSGIVSIISSAEGLAGPFLARALVPEQKESFRIADAPQNCIVRSPTTLADRKPREA